MPLDGPALLPELALRVTVAGGVPLPLGVPAGPAAFRISSLRVRGSGEIELLGDV